MTTFEVTIKRQGNIKATGEFYYDFTDVFNRKWRIVTKQQPNEAKRSGYIIGTLICYRYLGACLNIKNLYRPKISIFLGSLVPGKIEIGDIKIKREEP